MRSSALSRMIVDADYHGLDSASIEDMLLECDPEEPHIDVEMAERSSFTWMEDLWLLEEDDDSTEQKAESTHDKRQPVAKLAHPMPRYALIVPIHDSRIIAYGPVPEEYTRICTIARRMLEAWRGSISGRLPCKKRYILDEFAALLAELRPYGY